MSSSFKKTKAKTALYDGCINICIVVDSMHTIFVCSIDVVPNYRSIDCIK